MVIGPISVHFALLFLTSLLQAGASQAGSSAVPEESAKILHHELFVEVHPDTHSLIGEDRLTLEVAQAGRPFQLSLASSLILDRMTISSQETQGSSHDIPFEIEHVAGTPPVQRITISSPLVAHKQMTITMSYHGIIDDPPREPRHLRFVTPSETAGHVGSEGIYLSSESGWYPDTIDSLSTYRLRVAMPEGWTGVTQAKPQSRATCPPGSCRQAGMTIMQWDTTAPAEALTFVANRFVSKTREWKTKQGQSIELATYLFQEDAHLADEYLEAAARYLDAYVPLLGPYPFETFAVVENFFASGLGMPSFTLLGSGVIKRHYVQPYALGHEIVHSWIGNSVFNRVDRGNWVEGLTTYLANYYWYELTSDQSQARQQRLLFLRGYNLHVPPDRDYPVNAFKQKQNERDNAIGYQKSAMVFHLLRQEVGEQAFWKALKRLVAQYSGRHAEWRDVERVVAEASGRDLRWFFAQWIEQAGAPSLSIANAAVRPSLEDATSFQLDLGIAQTGRPFRLAVQILVRTEDGRDHIVPVQLNESLESLSMQLTPRPVLVALDPDTMVMRRIPRASLPPVLNHFVTDSRRSILPVFPDQQERSHPFRDLIARIQDQDGQKPESERTTIVSSDNGLLFPQEGSVLVLGGPDAPTTLEPLLATHCRDHIRLNAQGIVVDGKSYEGAGTALLASCHRKDRPGSVVSLLYAMTPQAASAVSRLLFFYGWSSFVVFQDGAVVTRGEWPVAEAGGEQMGVRLDGAKTSR